MAEPKKCKSVCPRCGTDQCPATHIHGSKDYLLADIACSLRAISEVIVKGKIYVASD